MKKNFFSPFSKTLGAAASITGSVIGAGFITGKEISVFICGDYSVAGIYLFFLFFLSFIFVLSLSGGRVLDKIVKPIIALISVLTSSCMVAALDVVYKSILRDSEYFKILTIITVILAIFISVKGIEAMNVFALFAMPFVILFSVILSCVFKENGYVPISPEGLRGIFFPVLYAGVNCLLSSRIIIDSTRGLTLKNKCLVSVCVSVFLTICIFAISSCIKDKSGEMPFAEVVSKNIIYSIIFDIIMIFSIFTSLVSSVYTSFSVINGKTSAIKKIIVTLVFVSLSGLGFSKLVENIYPVAGVVGTIYFLAIVVSLKLSPKSLRLHTSRPQEYRVLR